MVVLNFINAGLYIFVQLLLGTSLHHLLLCIVLSENVLLDFSSTL